MRIVYRVNVGFYVFDFHDHSSADTFAVLAKMNEKTKSNEKRSKVYIEYLTEEEANE